MGIGRRELLIGGIALLASAMAARAQDAAPPGELEPDQPDIESIRREGFEEVELAERLSDPRTQTLRDRFVIPIERSVGQDGTHGFEWGLDDLNGDGFSDVIIVPRAPGLGLGDRYDGIRMVVYTFDGKEWHKSIDAGGLAVAKRVSTGPNGKVHEVAFLQSWGYFLYRWDGKSFVEVPR